MNTEPDFSNAEKDRQDLVDNAIYQLLHILAGRDPGIDPLPWDIDVIGDIRDLAFDFIYWQTNMTEQEFYPYRENK